ncbi:MAG: 50S ribosomal protein L6 [Leptospiraceae bacterium]|nr:50S ribosomal protein L6 [Leptospiraceae bacterium]MCP5501960.1 50S ribosomal protein L6 [Leptospiraceae bacterium]
MSRIGKNPVTLPEKVEVKPAASAIEVKGPLGTLVTPLYEGIEVKVDGKKVVFSRKNEEQKTVALHGLVRALFNNCVKGVSEGWEKRLEITGVGYRAAKKGKDLVLNLGYSHEVVFHEPDGVKIEVQDANKIRIFGPDKQQVGQVAADIRSFRMPEPYKGKGIKYSNEYIRRKAGKTGKK